MPGYVEISIRTLSAFLILWLFVQFLGKQIISQKTYHLYIASITIGTIAGNLAFNIKIKSIYFIISFIILGVGVYVLNQIAVRSTRFRKWIAGEPAFLIQDGNVLDEVMERMGYSLDSLKQALRGKDIFDIEEVECAILENNGSLSVLKKAEYKTITKKDLPSISETVTVPIELIYDGNILHHNLEGNLNEEWLLGELKKRNLAVTDISYAVLGTKGNFSIEKFPL